MYNITTIRATIFYTPIKYSKEFVSSLSNILVDFVPVIMRNDNPLQVPQTWQLISPDEKDVLVFNGDKIDYVRIIEGQMDEASISAFVNHSSEVFGKIMEGSNYPCSRIALAPTVVITENGARPDALYERLFGIREFQQTRPAISNVSQVFRVNKVIGGKDVTINHVANFHVVSELVNVNGRNQIRERYLCDFDINTRVDPNYRFNLGEVKEFFTLSTTSFNDYYNLYLG